MTPRMRPAPRQYLHNFLAQLSGSDEGWQPPTSVSKSLHHPGPTRDLSLHKHMTRETRRLRLRLCRAPTSARPTYLPFDLRTDSVEIKRRTTLTARTGPPSKSPARILGNARSQEEEERGSAEEDKKDWGVLGLNHEIGVVEPWGNKGVGVWWTRVWEFAEAHCKSCSKIHVGTRPVSHECSAMRSSGVGPSNVPTASCI